MTIDKSQEITEELLYKINRVFRCESHPKTYNECIEYYTNKLKHIFGVINIFHGVKKQVNKKCSLFNK